MSKNFYSVRIVNPVRNEISNGVKNTAYNRVNIVLSASKEKWDADIFKKLADVMNRHEIIKLYLPLGEASFRITHFPTDDLKTLLVDLNNIGFSIECPLASKR